MKKFYTYYFETDVESHFPVSATSEEQAREICEQLGVIALWVNKKEPVGGNEHVNAI